MDAVEFLKEKARMTKRCGIDCGGCLLSDKNKRANKDCASFEYAHPEKAVEIIEKWSKEHPRKTMMQDFFEKHPNAPKRDSGDPKPCPYHVGYTKGHGCTFDDQGKADCALCWSRPLEEGE